MLKASGIAAALLALVLSATAQDVLVRRVSGENASGRLLSISPEEVILASGDSSLSVPTAEIVSLRVRGAVADVPVPGSSWLRFDMAGGDVVYGTISGSDYDTVSVDTPLVGPLTLPLDATRRMVVLANVADMARSAGEGIEADRDVLFLRSTKGVDHVIGDIARFGRDGVWFEWNDDDESLFRFKEDRVVAVRLAEPEPLEDRGEGLAAAVWGRDGSRLSGRLSKEKGGELRLSLPTGASVTIDVDALALVTLVNERMTFLPDLEPSSFVETPYLEGGLTFGLHRDEGLRGGTVVAGGVHFPRCLAVHSRSDVSYALGGDAKRFSVGVAVDDSRADLPVQGAVSFSVLVDGEVVAGPIVRRAGEEPQWIDLDVKGVKSLTLRADFADNFHFNGWAVWGAPVLVR